MKWKMLVIVILTCSVLVAEQTKTLERSFSVKTSQKIILNDFSGAKLLVKSWDKNEAYVKLKVKFSSSDDAYEKEFINSLKLKESSDESELQITLDQTSSEGGGWSFLGIKIRFNYYEKKNITGEIYLPEKNNFWTNVRYGELWVEDLRGEVELFGKSNKLLIKNCPHLRSVENDYGKTEITDCGGNLLLKNKSSEIDIKKFNGSVKIEADYSNINIAEVTSKLLINSKSGTHQISNVKGDVTINSDYSDITMEDIDGFAEVINSSGSLIIDNAAGVKINGDYSNIEIRSVSGKTDKEMKIKGKSGNLEIDNFTGNLSIDNPYSNMDLRNIKGNVEITSKSASIRAAQITGNWKSNTEYMSIKVRDLSAKSIDIINRSNPIRLDLKTVPNDISIENEYGNVEIVMPEGFGGDIDMNVTYGEIETNLPIKSKNLGSSAYVVGHMGNGSGKLSIQSKSGNIKVNQKGSASHNSTKKK